MEAWSLSHRVIREVTEASLLMEKDGLKIIKLKSSHQVLDSNKCAGEGLEFMLVPGGIRNWERESQLENEMKTFF